jgi:hypothetical protein
MMIKKNTPRKKWKKGDYFGVFWCGIMNICNKNLIMIFKTN